MSDSTGHNLIFAISQPRAGSTLLQRILGSHPDILTVAEPWLMLPPLIGLDERKRMANPLRPAWQGTRLFIDELPGGRMDYYEGVRRMYGYLYGRMLETGGRRFFLDKTPRYYTIIPELAQVFPEARFIILLRNPLAVCASMIERFERGEAKPHHSRADLLDAPGLLLDGIALLGERASVLRYEELVSAPEETVERVCGWLGIDFRPEIIAYGKDGAGPAWKMGDPRTVYAHDRPVTSRLDAWADRLGDVQVWHALDDYLHALGEKTITELGYPYAELEKTLNAHRPSPVALARSLPLALLLTRPRQRPTFLRRVRRWLGGR